MLELKNVNKIYKSKNANDTEALKNVNISFNNVGMTFILGKSGCGKSTLLNILGGLDIPTSGEIVFKGKSFNSFKDKDYDSYRNTSVGFVFQEYNLIEKFNVFDNVSYALKLQNKKIEENVILDVLDKVGIKDLAKRKVNELSGGQKQRVAIARALVKNPSIILADEPTGNLDSDSSKMIFEILKKLSEERLVIVVSHDEESANTYGNRIIKLEDGMLVNDSNNQVMESDTNYILEKNHLPFKEAFRFSVKNLFGHKVKLFFAIILIAFGLSFFGFSIMQNYLRSNKEMERIVNEFDVNYIDIEKLEEKYSSCIFKGYWRNCYNEGKITKEEYQKLSEEKETKLELRYRFQVLNAYIKSVELSDEEHNTMSYYYSNNQYIGSFSELKKEDFTFKLIGKVPDTYDEIVIIKPVADYIIKYGVYLDTDEEYKPNSYEEIINDNKYLKFGNAKVKISGIIDDDISEFEPLKSINNNDIGQNRLSLENSKLVEKYKYKYPVSFYVLDGFKDNIELDENSTRYFRFSDNNDELKIIKTFEQMSVYTENGLIEMSDLDSSGIIVNSNYLDMISQGEFSKKMNEYIIKGKDVDPTKTSEEYRLEFMTNYIKENNITNKGVSIYLAKLYSNDEDNKEIHLKIVGVILDSEDYFANKEVLNQNSDQKYTYELYVLTKNIKNYNNFFKEYPIDGTQYISTNDFIYSIAEYEFTMKVLAKYLFIISLIFSLFAVLLLFNFIGLSITDNKKEIGVLRALGTTKKDVSKIYSIQGLIIGFVSYILSIILLIFYSKAENDVFLGQLLKNVYNIQLFGISFSTLAIMFVFFVVVVLLSVVSVSLRITKMRPIDAINNK